MNKKICIPLIILCFCISLPLKAIKPDNQYKTTPSDMHLIHEVKQITTSDGYHIRAWHLLPQVDSMQKWVLLKERKDISIIISYGDMGNMSYWLHYGISLAMKGYDVWMYDYRGFGESSPFEINSDYLYYTEFETDLSAVVEHVRQVTEQKICLFGLSMGTLISMNYLNDHSDNINYYIGDGHIYSPSSVKERLGEETEILLPENRIDYDILYSKVAVPMLLFYATNDMVLTKKELDTMKKINSNIKVEECECGHLQCFYRAPETYLNVVESFLKKE